MRIIPREALRGAFFFSGGGRRQGSFTSVLVRVSGIGMHGVSLDGCYWLEGWGFLILNYGSEERRGVGLDVLEEISFVKSRYRL